MTGQSPQPRSIVHLNVVDFAASVERVARQRLIGRPLIVAHPGAARARVLDMSEEAYQAGVRKRMPLDRARKICREARVLPPRPDLYQRAMAALSRLGDRYSPLVESGEEDGHLYLDLTGTGRLWGLAQDAAWRLRKEAREAFRLDPTWSVATNKLVAKAATRLIKPDGEFIVRPGEEESFLRPLPIHLLPGLEQSDLRLFRELNISRVGQAAGWTPAQLEAVFGRRGLDLNRWVRGVDHAPVLPPQKKPPRVELVHEFVEDTNQVPEVEAALFALVERAGAGAAQTEAGRQADRGLPGLLGRGQDGPPAHRQDWHGHRPGPVRPGQVGPGPGLAPQGQDQATGPDLRPAGSAPPAAGAFPGRGGPLPQGGRSPGRPGPDQGQPRDPGHHHRPFPGRLREENVVSAPTVARPGARAPVRPPKPRFWRP